jgi:lysine-specific demethylase 8
MFPRERADAMQVSVTAPDARAHPDFISLPYLACMLQAGEMLYIPKKWWHHVASMTTSLSISYWWV